MPTSQIGAVASPGQDEGHVVSDRNRVLTRTHFGHIFELGQTIVIKCKMFTMINNETMFMKMFTKQKRLNQLVSKHTNT